MSTNATTAADAHAAGERPIIQIVITTEPGIHVVEIAEVRCTRGAWFARLVHAKTGVTLCWDRMHAVPNARSAQAMVGVRGRARLAEHVVRGMRILRVAEWQVTE